MSKFILDRCDGNPITNVSFENIQVSQFSFNLIMDRSYGITSCTSLSSFNMSNIDFADITDLSSMYTMDNLEELIFADSSNLDGESIYELITELESLNYLDVSGLWDNFGHTYQNYIYEWGTIDGNTLVVPEPCSILLLSTGGFVLNRFKK